MTMHKIRFPFWIMIVIAIAMCCSVIFGNIWAIKFITREVGKPTEIGLFRTIPARKPLTKEHIIAIATIVTPSAMFIANVILVVITLYYARQTTKMAEATSKVAEETSKLADATNATSYIRQQEWKTGYRPLFMPNREELRLSTDSMSFLFTNVGQHALFVEFSIDGHNEKFKDRKHKVMQWQDIEFGDFNTNELMTEVLIGSPEIHMTIEFQDVLLNKYKQCFIFVWKRMKFVINKSCLPVENIAENILKKYNLGTGE